LTWRIRAWKSFAPVESGFSAGGLLDPEVVLGLVGDESWFDICYLSYESGVEETSYHPSWRTGYLRGLYEGWRVGSGATLELELELRAGLIDDKPIAMINVIYRNNAHLLKQFVQYKR
jgi:hypothetical protein